MLDIMNNQTPLNGSDEKIDLNKVKTVISDFNYFSESINGNIKDNFFSKYGNKEDIEEMLESDFKHFTAKIVMYKKHTSKEYPDYSDFDFMDKYIRKIYTTLFTKENIPGVFESDEIKNKFFTLTQKYFFGNLGKMIFELAQKYPSEKTLRHNSEDEKNEGAESTHLTADEIKSLLE